MKKFYVLLSVMVLALMTAGFSYAYWSDTLTVNGTANTGSLGVELVLDELDPLPEYVTEESSVSLNGKTLTVELTNLYPGATYEYTGHVKNVGTIPAQLLDIVSVPSSASQVEFDFVLLHDTMLDTTEVWYYTLTITVPDYVTDFENDTASASYTLNFGQFNQ